MPKKASGNFDQQKYVNSWIKENHSTVSASFKKDFVAEFKASCKVLGVSQAQIFKKAMEDVIEKAKNK